MSTPRSVDSPDLDSKGVSHVVDEGIASLSRRMAAMDEEAFRRFFREYYPRLHGYSLKLAGGNHPLAEDVTQETLLRVARHIKPVESSEEFCCWLVLLTRCAFIDALRKERRYRDLLDSVRLENEIAASPAGRSIGASESLHAALRRLRPRERRLLLAKYRDEESYESIASDLGLSAKAVESRLARVRKKVRSLLSS